MSTISFGDLLKKSFRDGKIHANYLEQLLSGVLTRYNLENIHVEFVEESAENSDVTQSDPESEVIINTNNFDSTINFTNEEDSESNSSIMNYFSNNYNSQSFQTLGLEKGSHVQELPAMKALPPLNHLNIGTNSIIQLESHIRKHCDAVNLIISQNQFFLQHQICEVQNQLSDNDEKIKDLFFACEQNEEKSDEALSNLGTFNEKIFCLKSDVKILLKESEVINGRLIDSENDYKSKAYMSEVEEMLMNLTKEMYSQMEFLTKLKDFNEESDKTADKFAICNQFEKNVKKAILQLKVEIDEKLENDELEKFKITSTTLFDDFIKDIKVLLYKKIEKVPASGVKQNLTCLSCESKISELKSDFNMIDNSAARFKFFTNKIPVPKKDISRINFFCNSNKKQVQKSQSAGDFTCHTKESLLSFPSTRQCFIISKDNSIFKADPLQCLKNSNYTKI